jgi:pimeloyl-ACP methyl ester carboxylesterase
VNASERPALLKTILWLVSIAALVYVAVCIGLFAFQRSLLYFPQPAAFGGPDTTILLAVPGAELHVWVRRLAGPKALVYLGGNAEDVSASLGPLAGALPEHSLYLLHYRGYGGSSGSPSEEAIQRDAQALFDKVRETHPDITVVGRSLGTGVAIRLATQRPVSRLVLVTPYDSIQEIGAKQFPLFPIRWLIIDKFESWRHAPAIRVPTLLITAERDKLIPLDSTERLLAAFDKGVARLIVVPGADHNSILAEPAYFSAIKGAL